MPGLITHYLCGDLVFKRCDFLKKANRDIFNLGAQGPDIFFYYAPFIRKGYQLSSCMHSTDTSEMFRNMMNILVELPAKEKNIGLHYFCGYLCHYAMDLTAHPYIFYKTGQDEESHVKFETAIDTLMLHKIKNTKPSKINVHELVTAPREKALSAGKLLAGAIHKTYGIKLTPQNCAHAMRDMMFITKNLQSKAGFKRYFIAKAEKIVKIKNVSNLIHTDHVDWKIDYLNEKKKFWSLPWDNTVKNNISFTDMFSDAHNMAEGLCRALYKWLNKELEKNEFLSLAGNKSFLTGLDCKESLRFHAMDELKRI